MRFGQYTFKPPLWAIPVVILLVVSMTMLGNWQVRRAHYKEHLIEVHKAAVTAGPQPLDVGAANSAPRKGYHYIAHGHYDPEHQILLADQVQGAQTGYRVWTPLILDNGVQVMIDRGWVVKPSGKNAPLPDPSAPTREIDVRGYWQGFPQPGLSFGERTQCNAQGWPRAFDFPNAKTVRCQYPQRTVADGLLLLDADEPNGFSRQWDEDPIGLKPWVHYLYAGQWYLFVLLSIGLFAHVSVRRDRPGGSGFTRRRR